MDMEDVTVFDYDPTVSQIIVNPKLFIECHPNRSARSRTNGLCETKGKIMWNVSSMKNSEVTANQMTNIVDETNLSEQIQQASGTSYSNHIIENNFSDSLEEKATWNQYKERVEGKILVDSDPFRTATMSETFKPTPTLSQISKPNEKSSFSKRKGGRREFRKLNLIPLDTEKTVSDIFKKPQTFNPEAWKNKDSFRLGSKCDFPGL